MLAIFCSSHLWYHFPIDSIMGVFTDFKLTDRAITVIESRLSDNPYYPFTRVGDDKFVLYFTYHRVYVFLGIGLSSLYYIVANIGSLSRDIQNAYFLYAVVAFIASFIVIWSFKDPRVYIIDGQKGACFFRMQKSSLKAVPLHNIYVRLRRTEGTSGHYYYLIFNGKDVEGRMITGTTRRKKSLRKAGQLLASNLGINYFDERNVSEYHNIRHNKLNLAGEVNGEIDTV
ncbi:hypothetical protein P9112_004387 [Eukaryota sp. TZLM1-RC]